MFLNVHNDYVRLVECTDAHALELLDEACSYDVDGAQYSEHVQSGHWDGRKHLFSKRTGLAASGLLQRMRTVLDTAEIAYTIKDNRVKPTFGASILLKGKVPYPWQNDIFSTCLTNGRGLVRVATGGGKGMMTTYLVGHMNLPTVVMVNKLDILLQLKDWFETGLGIKVGHIGGGIVEPGHITLMMAQTAANAYKIKHPELDEDDTTNLTAATAELIRKTVLSAEVLHADEAHGLVSGLWYKLHAQFKNAYYRFAWTATPPYLEGKSLMLEAAFGPRLVDIGASDLIRAGYLTKPKIYFVNLKHERQAANMTYQELYAQEVTNNQKRNMVITKMAATYWSNGHRILIGVQHLRHGDILHRMLTHVVGAQNVRFLKGENESSERRSAIRELNDGKTRILIATKIFSEGVDIPNLTVCINAKAQLSYIDYIQLIGRALRKAPGKKSAYIVDFYDHGCRHLTGHSKERLDIVLKEPEFDVMRIDEEKILA